MRAVEQTAHRQWRRLTSFAAGRCWRDQSGQVQSLPNRDMNMSYRNTRSNTDANRDPITGGVAESIDPTREDTYWRENFTNRPYIKSGSSFVDYGPAYGYGVNSYSKFPGRAFDEVEPELSRDWNKARSKSQLDWEGAKSAARDAWNRLTDSVERALPGDSDRDGK
jgi:hypothetical protein